jgi:cobalt-zinc-cadmium resistance protein CzcA
LSLGLIALLLRINFGSVPDMLLAMSVIPMAVAGGVIGLFVTGVPFSVSAAIGFIALFGISVMDGIVTLSQYNLLIESWLDRTRAALRTGELQMRPVLMTCVIAGVGLLQAALSTGIGSQVQKAVGDRRGRRHDAGAARHPHHIAGPHRHVFTAEHQAGRRFHALIFAAK